MNSTGLKDHFRSQAFDLKKPYFWSDPEVYLYANDAYRTFTRLTGGIQDFTSAATLVPVATGEATAEISTNILRTLSAYRVSDGAELTIVNLTDPVAKQTVRDYGQLMRNVNKPVNGPLTHMMIGRQRGIVEWTVLPTVDDEVRMTIFRTPLETIDGDGQSLDEIEEQHHIHLVDWMKSLAYRKDDPEVQNLNKAAEYEQSFRNYCESVKSEIDRAKHKTRVVRYGGL